MARAGMLGKLLASGSAVAFTLAAAPAHRQNLFTYSDPTDVGAAAFPLSSNVSAITSSYITHPGGGTFAGGVAFGDNGSQRYAYKQVTGLSVGARYIVSFYVLMGDASAPSVGLTNTTGDFAIIARGGICPNAATVTSVGSSVYRVSAYYNPVSGDADPENWGIIKYTGQSAKTFKATGFQLEKVPSVSSTVGTYTPTGATAEYGKYRLSSTTQRVWDATATVTVLEEGHGAKAANPGALPGATVHGVAIHPNGNWAAGCDSNSPYIKVWDYADATGLGAASSNPATLPAGQGNACAFSPDGAYLAVAHNASPYLSVYPFNATTGAIGTRLSDPATPPTGNGKGVAWSPSGAHLAVAHATTPFVSVYPFSGGAIGTKISDPATAVAGDAEDCCWSPDGTLLVVAHDAAPYVTMYAFSGGAIGAKKADAATTPTGTGASVEFNPAGTYLAVGHVTTPFVSVYPISSGAFGTKVANPATLPAATVECVRWSPSGNHLLCVNGTSDGSVAAKLHCYPFAGAFAPKLAGAAVDPAGTVYSAAWSPSGKSYVLGESATPYIESRLFSKTSSETWTPNRLDGWIQAAAANYARQGMLISSSYLPMTVFSEARAFSLKCSADALDSTAFQSTWKSFKQGLNQASGSLEAFRTTDATLVTALTAKAPLVLEFWDNTTDSSEPIARVRALAKGHGTDTSVADLVKEGFEFEAMADSDNRVIAFPILAL